MSVFSLDTNIVSFYLKGNQVIKDKLAEADTTGQKVVISPFAWYEVQRGLLASNKYAKDTPSPKCTTASFP
ncbi:hypothetical protein AGMMS49944_06890 [Spirochaetia bacterium]|nr:hypothetical protein AGMMS49944_06890 [Spirochaetia bacterium]